MNVISLTGRLVEDVRINYTNAGKEVANGTIAVQRNFKNNEGKYDADFIDFTCWGKKALVMAEYIKKGDKFGLSGELRTRLREKDNVKFKVSEVNVQDFDLPDKPKTNTQPQQETNPYEGHAEPVDVSDSSLPF